MVTIHQAPPRSEDQHISGLAPDDMFALQEIERRVLWLSTLMVHHANNVRENPDKPTKVGGHQESSASVVSILTALYFHFLQAGDRVSIKPHASPAYHAVQYLLGNLDRHYLTTLRELGAVHGYETEEFTHLAVAATVAAGRADAAFGLRAAAHRFGLDFIPARREVYWLALRSRRLDSEAVQALRRGISGDPLRQAARGLAGYSIRGAGTVMPVGAVLA